MNKIIGSVQSSDIKTQSIETVKTKGGELIESCQSPRRKSREINNNFDCDSQVRSIRSCHAILVNDVM